MTWVISKIWKHNSLRSIGNKLIDIGLGDLFFFLISDIKWKEKKSKKYISGTTSNEKASAQQRKMWKEKKQPTEREEIFANHVFDNVLVYKIYKELIQINSNNKFDEKMGRMPK